MTLCTLVTSILATSNWDLRWHACTIATDVTVQSRALTYTGLNMHGVSSMNPQASVPLPPCTAWGDCLGLPHCRHCPDLQKKYISWNLTVGYHWLSFTLFSNTMWSSITQVFFFPLFTNLDRDASSKSGAEDSMWLHICGGTELKMNKQPQGRPS